MGSITESQLPAVSPELREIFHTMEQTFSSTSLGVERWYIVAVATLAGGNDPELCAQLYLYLISRPDFSTHAQRQAMIRRVREALVKAVSIVGVCRPLEAIMAINEFEQDEDKDLSSTREGWQCDEDNLERGMGWMKKLYSHNTDSTVNFFKDHKDFMWISKHITYGLYLSDRQVLDDVDTQMVVLPAIMIQNLPKETHWHIRGTRRLGVSKKEVQIIWDSVQTIAKYLGLKLHRVPTVDEIEHDV